MKERLDEIDGYPLLVPVATNKEVKELGFKNRAEMEVIERRNLEH